MQRLLRTRLANPLGLALLLASLALGIGMAALPALKPWADRTIWMLTLGVAAYVATIVVVGWERRGDTAPHQPATAPARGSPHRPDYPDGLTAREVEVLRLLAGGKTNKEIAAILVLSTPTVERHITNLYAKIGARGRTEATVYALTHGLAEPANRP